MKRVNIELELPDELAERAEAAGLLTPKAIEEYLQEEIQRRALDRFLAAADRSAELDLTPMTEEEVQAEIDAVRAVKHGRATESR